MKFFLRDEYVIAKLVFVPLSSLDFGFSNEFFGDVL